MESVIVWFRYDLRTSDHPALAAAVATKKPIIPLYILDDQTPGQWKAGGASRWWLHHSLNSLSEDLKAKGNRLILRRGATLSVFEQVIDEIGEIEGVYFTRCYEPYEVQLEQDLKSQLTARDIACHRFGGRLLFEPEAIKSNSGAPYKVFTPFWKACLNAPHKQPLAPPKKFAANPHTVNSDRLSDWNLLPKNPNWAEAFPSHWTPGETGARKRLAEFVDTNLKSYKEDRDRPDLPHTSRLSPHLHFGEISPRECWHVVTNAIEQAPHLSGPGSSFLRELGWREFSTSLLHFFPDLPLHPFRPEFKAFPWSDDKAAFKAWTKGQTGYPLVDAGMRELWQTGWMHNRVRMIAASFLVKHLLIPWQQGEAWFWDTLVDADLSNNAASWQWVAGSGADAAPYFRIFNPIIQGKKFDPDGTYVRRWVPELADLETKYIHAPWEAPDATRSDAGITLGETYPFPLVEHKSARERALSAFEKIKQKQ